VTEIRDGTPAEPREAACRPWGVLTTILWVVAAEGIRALVDLGLGHSPLNALGEHNYPAHVLQITLSWIVPLLVLVVAVRLAGCAFAGYFAWLRPSAGGIALAIVTFLVSEAIGRGIPYLLTGSLAANLAIEDYRTMIAPGTWPWWYVLHYWPAAVYAPFVEETTYRGFLWRGLAASRLGNGGAWLLTSAFFAAIHYHYYIQDGHFIPGPLIGAFVSGLLFGFVRWRSGSTIASMITHSLSNIALNVLTVLAVMFDWP
jgi:membrane protease YdiL (CAAX protease family)